MTPNSNSIRALPGQLIQGPVVDAVLGSDLEYPREDASLRYDLLIHRPGVMDSWSRLESDDDMNKLWLTLRDKEKQWHGLQWAVVSARLGMVEKTNWTE